MLKQFVWGEMKIIKQRFCSFMELHSAWKGSFIPLATSDVDNIKEKGGGAASVRYLCSF